MKKYTLGFVFNPTMEKVALIEKQRPSWQAGKHNGVGGKIEPHETSIACIARETREESGVVIGEAHWMHVAVLGGDDWNMDVYAAVHTGGEGELATLTDETVQWFPVSNLPETALSNVPWLVHLAKDKLQNKKFGECVVRYI